MRFSTALRDYPRRRIEKLGRVDIVVGVPSYNNENTAQLPLVKVENKAFDKI